MRLISAMLRKIFTEVKTYRPNRLTALANRPGALWAFRCVLFTFAGNSGRPPATHKSGLERKYTLTMKKRAGARGADSIIASKNFRHFSNRLYHAVLGSRAKRYGARLTMVIVLEISADHRLHFHCIIDRPCHYSVTEFAATIREQWWKTDFGYHHVDVHDQSDAGWTDYILKQRQKTSLFDP